MTKTTAKKCFVLSPIGGENSEARRHADMTLNYIVKPGVHAVRADIAVDRADNDARTGNVTHHIITSIKQADFLVADLTFLNENVFYELGVADAARKPVILIAQDGTKIPFDKVKDRVVFFDVGHYQTHLIAIERIKHSVEAILADGFKVSNPVSDADLWSKIEDSANPEQKALADINERLAAIEKQQLINIDFNNRPYYQDVFSSSTFGLPKNPRVLPNQTDNKRQLLAEALGLVAENKKRFD